MSGPNPVNARPIELDYEALRREAIEVARTLANGTWTDFSANEPGTTLLEALVFAVMDLSYIATHPVENLLTGPHNQLDLAALGLYSPEQVFASTPITMADYRRLALDRLSTLHNVWLSPTQIGGVSTGRYEVRYLAYGTLDSGVEVDHAGMSEALQGVLAGARALGDVFERPEPAPVHHIQLRATLHVAAPPGKQQLTNLVARIQSALAPPIEAESPLGPPASPSSTPTPEAQVSPTNAAASSAHKDWDSYWYIDGPPLKHGFIPTDSLWPLSDLDAARSTIARELGQTPWLSTVENLTCECPSAETPGVYQLDLQSEFHVIYPGGSQTVAFTTLTSQVPPSLRSPPRTPTAHVLPHASTRRGRYVNASKYRSIQEDLPAVYGVGKGSSSPHLEANAGSRQLKAYLGVFDQFLADVHAALGNLPSRMGVAPSSPSWPTQPIYGVPNIIPLLRGAPDPNPDPVIYQEQMAAFENDSRNTYMEQLRHTAGTAEQENARQRDALLHLLDRFGQDLIEQTGHNFESNDQLSRYLQDFGALSFSRAQAAMLGGGERRDSGIERRAQVLLASGRRGPLGLIEPTSPGEKPCAAVPKSYVLIEHGMLLPASLPEMGGAPPKGAARIPLEWFALRVSHCLSNWTEHALEPEFQHYVQETIEQTLPAHLLSEWRWLEQDAMAKLVALHQKWTQARHRPLKVLALQDTPEPAIWVAPQGEAYRLFQAVMSLENAASAAPPSREQQGGD